MPELDKDTQDSLQKAFDELFGDPKPTPAPKGELAQAYDEMIAAGPVERPTRTQSSRKVPGKIVPMPGTDKHRSLDDVFSNFFAGTPKPVRSQTFAEIFDEMAEPETNLFAEVEEAISRPDNIVDFPGLAKKKKSKEVQRLLSRFKKLPGIREKTLDEVADETIGEE